MSLVFDDSATLPHTSPISAKEEIQGRSIVNTRLWQQLKHPAVIRSINWGFCVTTGITAIGIFHCRGELLRAIKHGAIWGCVAIPLAHHKYMKLQRQDYKRLQQFQKKLAKTEENNITVYPEQLMDTLTNERIGETHRFIYDEYTIEEKEILQEQTFRIVKAGGLGLFGGLFGTYLLYRYFFGSITQYVPRWIKTGWIVGGGGFCSAMGIRTALKRNIEDNNEWNKPGKLKYEIDLLKKWNDSSDKRRKNIEGGSEIR